MMGYAVKSWEEQLQTVGRVHRNDFSSFVIGALVDTISGGHGTRTDDDEVGLYRTGPQIDRFLEGCGIIPSNDGSSRQERLRHSLRRADSQQIIRAIESVSDPRLYRKAREVGDAVRGCLNTALLPDGYQVVVSGGKAVLRAVGPNSQVLQSLANKTATLDFDTVNQEIERALKAANDDPADAVTAACAMLEAVCRSVLIELGEELPAKKDIDGLYRAVQGPLNLSPGRTGLHPDVEQPVRQVLGGLTTIAKGVGALRTNAGDAHGREKGRPAIDARIARLAIHTASSLALFLIETWERQQQRALPMRKEGE